MRHTCAPVLTQTVAETSVAQNKYEIGRSFCGCCDRAMAGSSRLYHHVFIVVRRRDGSLIRFADSPAAWAEAI